MVFNETEDFKFTNRKKTSSDQIFFYFLFLRKRSLQQKAGDKAQYTATGNSRKHLSYFVTVALQKGSKVFLEIGDEKSDRVINREI